MHKQTLFSVKKRLIMKQEMSNHLPPADSSKAKDPSTLFVGNTPFVICCSFLLILLPTTATILFPQNMKHDSIGISFVIATHLVLIRISLKVVYEITEEIKSKKCLKLFQYLNLFGWDKLHLISIFFVAYDFISAVLLVHNIVEYQDMYYILYVCERLLSCIGLTLPCFLLQMHCECANPERNKAVFGSNAELSQQRNGSFSGFNIYNIYLYIIFYMYIYIGNSGISKLKTITNEICNFCWKRSSIKRSNFIGFHSIRILYIYDYLYYVTCCL